MADEDRLRWDAKYEGRTVPVADASEALRSVLPWIPASGPALDIAGGDGGQAVWLALRGLEVTLCDVSGVALQRARSLAEVRDVGLTTVQADLEEQPLPDGPWALVLCANYLQPSIWKGVAQALAPGGVAIWLHPTVENLARNPKPSRRFLLSQGQGRAVFEDAGLECVFADEGWVGGRHLCRLVGRRLTHQSAPH